jgi:hypothetical protein
MFLARQHSHLTIQKCTKLLLKELANRDNVRGHLRPAYRLLPGAQKSKNGMIIFSRAIRGTTISVADLFSLLSTVNRLR